MDALLSRLGVQAMNYAIRSGLALTSTFAISQCTRLLKTVDDKGLSSELKTLQKLLNKKIQIISPAIDLIEFKSGRGNVFLESAVPLAKSLHREIVSLGKRLENAAASEENSRASGREAKTTLRHEQELRSIISDLETLLERIDRDIPLLQLAITGSGESLATSMPSGVSPSRLLQASKFLFIGDTQYAEATKPVQIGPSFSLSLYMLFLGHALNHSGEGDALQSSQKSELGTPRTPRTPQKSEPKVEDPYGLEDGARRPIWQEVIHKARVRLCRTPIDFEFDPASGYRLRSKPSADAAVTSPEPAYHLFPADEFAYHLEIVEDFDDGRVHDEFDNSVQSYDTIPLAGIRESIPIHHLSKIFYTDTGRILNVGNTTESDNNPVLLLKRDQYAQPPTRMAERLAGRLSLMRDEPSADKEVDSDSSYEQCDIDSQLRAESEVRVSVEDDDESPAKKSRWNLPSHLDPEWIALEVFEEDEYDSDESDQAELDLPSQSRPIRGNSLDSRIIDQIRNISVRSSPGPRFTSSHFSSRQSSQDFTPTSGRLAAGHPESLVARSPFGAITSSLSLMEMLIRLTSLQEFQQMSHLAIPDYILTFFLEETSTTGLTGEEKWRTRNAAKQRVGFDPYTDTPT